ncbi:uncharacterized protein G2W53_039669 [Senna tora]|uniref:Uncharacterized protein n=1 Tax=Senna tora TaxID=362788 RepID=A0A834SQY3_9FABA|nr:uncharacterized protein G2W53_039669 [Senna tora]
MGKVHESLARAGKSTEISSPPSKKSRPSSQTSKPFLVDLTKPLPSPPSLIPPGAKKDVLSLDYDLEIHTRIGDHAAAPRWQKLMTF